MDREFLALSSRAAREDELERANAVLKDAASQLRAVFEAIGEGFAVTEVLFDAGGRAADARVLAANAAFGRFTGIGPKSCSLREAGSSLVDERWLERIGEVVRTGENARFEQRVEASQKWFEVSASRIGEPELRRVALFLCDVSECKERELAACRTEKRQVFLLALSDALRALADPVEIQLTAARLLCQHIGVEHAMYIDVQHGIDGDYYVTREHYTVPGIPNVEARRFRSDRYGASLLDELRAGRAVVVADTESDSRLTLRDREAYRVSRVRAYATAPIVKQGVLVGVVSAVDSAPHVWTPEDIEIVEATAERTWAAVLNARAEASLRESEARLRLALDASKMGTFVWHAREDVSEPDARMLALFGLPESAPLNLAQPPDVSLYPDDRERYAAAVRAASDPSGTGSLREDIRVVHPDGSVHWLGITAQMHFEGKPPHADRLVGMAADITERKATEEALLEREERLRESDRRKDEFLAVLAHELRNPLAPIRTGLELLRATGDSGGTAERIRSMMERQVGHMVRLIDDLLDVSRLTFGTIHLHREPTALSSLINAAVETNRSAIDDAGIVLSVELPATAVQLDVDPTRFVQVIANLLNNAVKFTEARGWIRISASLGDELSVTVADSGQGISKQMLPRVFDLFTQGTADARRGQKGLGIGLALARRLVEMHGGSIEAFSEGPGKGSAFTVRLPSTLLVSSAEGEEGAGPWGEIQRRVAVIDDNRDAADTAAMFVATLGCDTKVAYDGESGVRLVLEFRPDLVLLDVGMPGMDGYETCRRIRGALGSDVVIVAMTGWGQERDKQHAKSAGFDDHLTKPVDPTLLRKLLADVASGRFSRRHSAA